MSNLEKEVDLLTQLLKENREVVRNALLMYEEDEGPLRMQKMLRDYFKQHKKNLQQQIEEEAQLISKIFPDIEVVVLQCLLYEAGEDVMRTKTVIKQLSTKNGFKRNSLSNASGYSPSKKQKMNQDVMVPVIAGDVEDKMNRLSVVGSSASSSSSESAKEEYLIALEQASSEAKYDEMLQILMDILPDADPTYLEKCFPKFCEQKDFNSFVMDALENRNYPTVKTTTMTQPVLSKQDLIELYTIKFSVTAFLEIIPDPDTYFKTNRVLKPWTPECTTYAFTALLNIYDQIRPTVVKKCFGIAKSFLDACDRLDKFSEFFSVQRKFPMPAPIQNIALLQEIAYKTHYADIMKVLKNREEQYNQKVADAKADGVVLTCNCCFDDEVLLEDTLECDQNCTFCKDCIKKSVEVAFGEGKLEFYCLGQCEGQFSCQVLKQVLPPKLFSRILDKRQAEEVKAADIENLEFCPFCDFAVIPAEGNNIFNCLNPECMRSSCRLCKEASHIPYRCNEVERDENVKARTYIENKMSDALLKKCKKCEKLYFKDNGCNMIMCSCGAKMCDACGKLVTNYSHFNQYGKTKSDRCPLWSDTLKLNEEKLKEVAENAKKEVNTSGQLKIDPTADIPSHFAELLTKRENAPDWNKADNFLKKKRIAKKITKTTYKN